MGGSCGGFLSRLIGKQSREVAGEPGGGEVLYYLVVVAHAVGMCVSPQEFYLLSAAEGL